MSGEWRRVKRFRKSRVEVSRDGRVRVNEVEYGVDGADVRGWTVLLNSTTGRQAHRSIKLVVANEVRRLFSERWKRVQHPALIEAGVVVEVCSDGRIRRTKTTVKELGVRWRGDQHQVRIRFTAEGQTKEVYLTPHVEVAKAFGTETR